MHDLFLIGGLHLFPVKSEPALDHQLLVPELPQLPVPHRPSTDILDVPEGNDKM